MVQMEHGRSREGTGSHLGNRIWAQERFLRLYFPGTPRLVHEKRSMVFLGREIEGQEVAREAGGRMSLDLLLLFLIQGLRPSTWKVGIASLRDYISTRMTNRLV